MQAAKAAAAATNAAEAGDDKKGGKKDGKKAAKKKWFCNISIITVQLKYINITYKKINIIFIKMHKNQSPSPEDSPEHYDKMGTTQVKQISIMQYGGSGFDLKARLFDKGFKV